MFMQLIALSATMADGAGVSAGAGAAVERDSQKHRSLVTIPTERLDSNLRRASWGATLTLLPGTYTGEMAEPT